MKKISAKECIEKFENAGYSLDDLTNNEISGEMMFVAHYFRWCLAKVAMLQRKEVSKISKRKKNTLGYSIKFINDCFSLMRKGVRDENIIALARLQSIVKIP